MTPRILACLPLLLAACAPNVGAPQISFETELGSAQQSMSGPGSNPRTTNLSGLYTGMGRVSRNPGGTCPVNEPVSNFRVQGDRVVYGQFSGQIAENGSIQMEQGRVWVVGQFNGPHFEGRYIMPACTYMISMDRTGP